MQLKLSKFLGSLFHYNFAGLSSAVGISCSHNVDTGCELIKTYAGNIVDFFRNRGRCKLYSLHPRHFVPSLLSVDKDIIKLEHILSVAVMVTDI